MSANGSSYILSTQVALNTDGAERSATTLTSKIRSSVSAMKAATAQATSYGDSLGAQQSKVSGLETVMNNLQSKIDTLKLKQQGLDTENGKGAKQFNQLQNQINNAEKQMANYSAQQDRAKQSLQYYSSGLADVQRSYQVTMQKSEAYSARLKAEGDDLNADKAKLKGYNSALGDMKRALELQESELSKSKSKLEEVTHSYNDARNSLTKLENAGKKNTQEYQDQAHKVDTLRGALSRATKSYDDQEIRVNKTGKTIAETTTKQEELNNSIKRIDGTPWEKLRAKMSATNKTGNETHSMFKAVFAANLATSAVSFGWQEITMHIGGALKAGMDFDKEQQKMIATWTTLTGKRDAAKDMVDDVNKLAVATGQSAEQTDELEQKFYHLHSSKEEAHNMTKAMLNMADAVGLNGQQIDAVSQDMTNALSRGKASAGEINQITQYFPMYREQLAKSKDVTVQQLNEMVKHGKISADDMEKVFEQLGNVKYGKAADNMLSTMLGAERVIKGRVPQLIGDIEKPIMNAKNPFTLAFSRWASDKQTDKEFQKIGNSINSGVQTITKAFSKSFNPKQLGNSFNKTLDGIANAITRFSKMVASHQKEISSFFKNFTTGSANTIKLTASVIGTLAEVTMPFISFMAKHSKVFAPIIVGMIGLSKVSKSLMIVSTIADAFKTFNSSLIATKIGVGLLTAQEKIAAGVQWALNAAMSANPIGIAVTAIGLLAAGFTLAYMKIKPFREWVNKTFSGLIKWIGKAAKSVGSFFGGIGKWWSKNQKAQKKANDKQIKQQQETTKKMKKDWDNLGKNIGRMWNDTKKNTGKIWDGFKKDSSKVGKSVGDSFKNVPKTTQNYMNQLQSGVNKTVSNLRKNTPKQFQNMWKDADKATKDGTKVNSDLTKTGADLMHGHWSKLGVDLRNTSKDMWKWVKDIFKGAFDWLNDLTGGRLGKIIKLFSDAWNNVKSGVGSLWSGIKSVWNDSVGWVVNKWNGMWDSVVGSAKNAVGSVHHTLVDIARNVINPINDMLGGLKEGINWVLDKVGAGKIKASWKIALPKYANGTNDTHPGGLAQVNDGAGSNYREMYQLSTGQIGMFPKRRNIITYLPKGTSVLDGERSAVLAKALRLPAYKNGVGKIINGAENAISGTFSKIWSKGSDLVDMADDILKKPIDFLNTVFNKFMKGISSKISLPSDVITHFPGTVAKSGVNWVKNLIHKMQEEIEGDPNSTSPAAIGNHKHWLKQAGIPESQFDMWNYIISHESGWNPRVRNPNGGAYGLPQALPGSKMAAAGKDWATNPITQLKWMKSYVNQRYGGIGGAYSYWRKHHNYENGGLISHHQMAEVGEGDMAEYVIPTDPNKHSRAEFLLNQAKSHIGMSNDSSQTNDELVDKVSKLESTVDKLTNGISQLVGLGKQQINAIYGTAQTPRQRYINDAQNGTISDYQLGGN